MKIILGEPEELGEEENLHSSEDQDIFFEHILQGAFPEGPTHLTVMEEVINGTIPALKLAGERQAESYLAQCANILQQATAQGNIVTELRYSRESIEGDSLEVIESQPILELIRRNRQSLEVVLTGIHWAGVNLANENFQKLLKQEPTMALKYMEILQRWGFFHEDLLPSVIENAEASFKQRLAELLIGEELATATMVYASATEYEGFLNSGDGLIANGNLSSLIIYIKTLFPEKAENIITPFLFRLREVIDNNPPLLSEDSYKKYIELLDDDFWVSQ